MKGERNGYGEGSKIQADFWGNIPKVPVLLFSTSFGFDIDSDDPWYRGTTISQFMDCNSISNICCFMVFSDYANSALSILLLQSKENYNRSKERKDYCEAVAFR
jgi:hypothetical protein